MVNSYSTLGEIYQHGFDSLIDARSPAEFAQDHIPGAINLPVLGDDERARVGTIYKQDSPFTAKKTGAALVAQNIAAHLQGPLSDKNGGWRPLVYCWRGGQRSGSFALILKQVGWRAEVLPGGFQTYRRLVASAMHDDPLPHNLIVLDGNTGTAKTELLHLLQTRGQQIVDLEGLARHRGSIFGAMAASQPTQKSFEGALACAFSRLDARRTVWVEAESSKIGNLQIPPSIWRGMKTAPRVTVGASIEERASYLTRAYRDIMLNPVVLTDRLARLTALHGRDQVALWQGLAATGQMQQLARELMQDHYDPSYGRSRRRHQSVNLGKVQSASLSAEGLQATAERLVKLAEGS